MATDDWNDLRADPAERDYTPSPVRVWLRNGVLLLATAAVGGAWWWALREDTPPDAATTTAKAAPPAAAEPTVSPPPLPANTQPLASNQVRSALIELLGAKAVAAFLYTEEFPRRFVATIDSLAREQSSPMVWPVLPTAGKFSVQKSGAGQVPATSNAARYTPFVTLASSVDAAAAVRVYARLYPLLQQAYADLGLGKRPFNDRLLQVIDVLLAAPEPAQPPQLQLTKVQGPVASLRPWTRYEYVDPQLEAMPAGQKIMVRMGLDNERKVKAKLRELRQALVAAGTAQAR
ncbi:MAG TPA: DUF3014 domain-containing protein [Ramlibacter sp.]|nr:DUF3014 domain-containing protein [Ramlibacter sp.]